MAHDVFISYSKFDKPTADAVCAVLEQRRIRCWIAPRDIVPGDEWASAITVAIRNAKAMVLVLSTNANQSNQIKREANLAVDCSVSIITLRVENVLPSDALAYYLGTPHWLDAFTPTLDRHLKHLGDVVATILERPAVPLRNQTSVPEPSDDAPRKADSSPNNDSSKPGLWRLINSSFEEPETAAEQPSHAYNRPRGFEGSESVCDQFTRAYQLANGLGVAKDEAAEAVLYRKIADQEYEDRVSNLRLGWKSGQFASRDQDAAVGAYMRAAQEGNKIVQFTLGVMLAKGQGVPQDQPAAVGWYRASALQGYAPAQHNLGLMLSHGRGVAKDEAAAVVWYREAADQGNAPAQFALGFMLANGQGVEKDIGSARLWMQKAAATGNPDAKSWLATH